MLLIINTNQEFLYRGEDAVNAFCTNLNEKRDDVKENTKKFVTIAILQVGIEVVLIASAV